MMKQEIYYIVFSSPIGELYIYEENDFITHLSFNKVTLESEKKLTPVLEKACIQLEDYFKGDLKVFDLPLNPQGTPFQKCVWQALKKIPYGQTKSYKDISLAIDNEKACRAVGMANNKNPIAILIPCHRVIGCNGKLVGYAGGLDVKEFLLNLENQYKQ